MAQPPSFPPLRPAIIASKHAFTLIESLIVLGMLSLLMLVFAPALTANRYNSHFIVCRNNLKRLASGWQMYASDNADRSALMLHGGTMVGGSAHMGWAEGWLDWQLGPDNTNTALLVDSQYAQMGPYVMGGAPSYKCPADTFVGLSQRSVGWHRVRSYSGNVYVGDGNAGSGPYDSLYRHITKITDFSIPSPAESWIFVEEHPDSMNDPVLFAPSMSYWIDQPATYHGGACSFSFADAHVEMHRWSGSLTAKNVSVVSFVSPSGNSVPTALPDDPDLHWFTYHTTRVSTRYY